MFAYTPASLEAIHANRESLLAALIKLNITEVIIRYEGGGDSGDVTELEIKPETVIPQLTVEHLSHHFVASEYRDREYHYHLEERQSSVDDALRDFAMAWANAQHSGWENNDGGSGTVTIHVAENSFQLEHTEYYTESSSYEYSL
ncbi:MAG: hypothetical protein Q7U16_04990 [Agitococcus sp.]|nr:hypothetical protein [Agitococcus sp.]